VKHLSKHLTFANVVSCIALFAALSGAAYAVTTPLGKKAVKTKNLANGAVTTLKLHGGAVTNLKLRNGAVSGSKIAPGAVGTGAIANGAVRSEQLGGGVVTTGKVKNGAITGEKLAGSAVGTNQLAASSVTGGKIQDGAITSQKLASSLLAQLVKNVSYVSRATETTATTPQTVTAECPAGKQVVGGGLRTSRGTATVVEVTGSVPFVSGDGKRTGWTATALGGGGTFAVEATAICAEF
jgi:hypothetical protein